MLSKSPLDHVTLSPRLTSPDDVTGQQSRGSESSVQSSAAAAAAAPPRSRSLHAVGRVQRVMEEGLRGGERGQVRVEGGRGGRGGRQGGRRRAGGEAVAEVPGGGRRGVGVLLQRGGGVVAVGGAVVQVRGRRCGAELGLQHQARVEEGLRVDVLLEPGGRRNAGYTSTLRSQTLHWTKDVTMTTDCVIYSLLCHNNY